MRIYDIIEKKKHGCELSSEEINFFVRGFCLDEIPDYQISALLMAIYFRGMSAEECACLTEAIAASGSTVSPELLGERTADKHSSGGVGDKTTLIEAPLAASLGCTVAKMSGRGLGHTGGTVDKLEAFPGFRTSLSEEEFISQIRRIGIAVVGQTENITPADKRLYALRDVTATVDSIPLIAASIMSKKLAAGSRSITLDVKCGSGAFMKTEEEACELARTMVGIGTALGRRTSALVTDMSFPLGRAVGNILEVKEAVEVLSGKGDERLSLLCVELCADMALGALGGERAEHARRARENLKNGKALLKFREWLLSQGAEPVFVHSPELLPVAPYSREVRAVGEGYAVGCDAQIIGRCAMTLGAGRAKKEDKIDPTAGVEVHIKRGDPVRRGDLIATLYTSNEATLDSAEQMILRAYTLSKTPEQAPPVVLARITEL